MKTVELEIPDGAVRVVLLKDGNMVRTEDYQKYCAIVANGYMVINVEDDDKHDYELIDQDVYMDRKKATDEAAEETKITIAYKVVEIYEQNEDQDQFEELVLEVVQTRDEGFALGMFVALQLMRNYGQVTMAKEFVECTGGIDFLEEHIEEDSDVDNETIDWLKETVFA